MEIDLCELLRAAQMIAGYQIHLHVPLDRALVRLDGLYGNGAIAKDLDAVGLRYVMRGKDYDLLDLPQIQARLTLPPDQHTTHPETGTHRALFDFPDVLLTPTGPRSRVIVATHPATTTAAPIGVTRDQLVYELFFDFPATRSFHPR